MKLRSLFLASIAALAMASCSNEENEVVDNAGKTETALMQFGITFPQSVASRATGDTEEGLEAEQKFTDVLLVIVSDAKIERKTINRNEFIAAVLESNKDAKYYQSAPFETSVGVGAVDVYAVLNANETLKTTLQNLSGTKAVVKKAIADIKAASAYANNSLDGLTDTGLAANSEHFLMFGEKEATLNEKQINQVSVDVNRVVAKIKEESGSLAFETQNSGTGQVLEKKIALTLDGYTFTNLNQTSYLKHNTTALMDLLAAQQYPSAYAYAYTYKTMNATGGVANANQITYCFENESTEKVGGTEVAGNSIVSVIYRAQMAVTGIEANANIYVYNFNVYNYATLVGVVPGFAEKGLKDDSSIALYKAQGITKYVGGKCYYRAEIKTGSDSKILRNNVYKLNVLNITKLGFPTPEVITDMTAIQLNITVKAWTVNLNDFEL